MNIFAYSTDDKVLEVFPNKGEAIAYCEGIDIENGGWFFWDEFGISMEAKFYEPNQKGKYWVLSGKYDLLSLPKGPKLIDCLPNVAYVEGRGLFKNANEIRKYLIHINNRSMG